MNPRIHLALRPLHLALAVAALSTLNPQLSTLFAQGTAFTYQGELTDAAVAANGAYDLRFAVYDAATNGATVSGTLTNAAVGVTNGLFTVTLDFGAGVFLGTDRWLEIGARTNGGGGFATLNPRQKITATPYAITAGNLSGTLSASQLSGTIAPANIGNSTISGAMLLAGAVGSNQLASGAVTTGALADGAVTGPKLSSVSNWFALMLTKPSPAAGDFFGTSVAAVGGDRVLIGAPHDNLGTSNTGAAYLFSTNGILLTTFTNPTPTAGDNFGSSVAAMGNDRVLIGADNDHTGTTNAGAAYLFHVNGTLLATFTNPTPANDNLEFGHDNDAFGFSVAAVGNDLVLIGAPFNDDLFPGVNLVDSGAAYLFNTNGVLLATITELLAKPFVGASAQFGYSVAAFGSDRMLISSPVGSVSTNVEGVGEVFLFRTNGTILTIITNPTPTIFDQFGVSVAAVGNDRILIGANLDNTSGDDAGIAYLYDTNGVLLTTFTNPAPEADDQFGTSVAAMGNDRVLIGAPFDNLSVSNAGAAYLFSASGVLLGTFTNPAPAVDDRFGVAVAAMGSDRALIGSSRDDIGATDTGAAYLLTVDSYSPGVIAAGVRAGSIIRSSLTDGAINSAKIEDGTITTADIEDGAVTATKIGGVLNASQIPNLDASKITSGTLPDARLATISTPGKVADTALSDNVALRAGGNSFTGDQSITSGSLLVSLGSNGSPGLAFVGDPNTGIFEPSVNANTVAIATAGGERMRVDGSGHVGIGTTSPATMLDVAQTAISSSADPGTNVSRHAIAISSARSLPEYLPGLVWYTTENTAKPKAGIWSLIDNNGSYLYLGTSDNYANGITKSVIVDYGGNVFGTSFNPISDRNAKENFSALNSRDVLDKVLGLDISRWNFKGDSAAPHIGPMAQDFYTAFGLGSDDKHIATVDADGVALAAIQGLNEKLEQTVKEKDAAIESLKVQNRTLEERLRKLEQLVSPAHEGAK